MGIIDTLSAGFDLVRKRPWLMALPVALDVGLWLAPKLSILSLVRSVVAELPAAVTGGNAEALREQGQMLVDLARSINVASLLSSTYLGVPGLGVGEMTSFFGRAQQVIELQGGLSLLALSLGLLLAGLLLASFYLGLIAQAVRDGRVDWRRLVARLPRYWLRLVGVGLIIVVVLASFTLPASLVMWLLTVLSPGLASLFMSAVLFLAFWMMLYMLFVPEAILFSEDGVVKAIWRSAMILRASFWPALGLLLLINVISGGLLFVWERLAVTAAGAIVAIVANAFIGTGLTAALFVFYRERLRAPGAAVEPQRS